MLVNFIELVVCVWVLSQLISVLWVLVDMVSFSLILWVIVWCLGEQVGQFGVWVVCMYEGFVDEECVDGGGVYFVYVVGCEDVGFCDDDVIVWYVFEQVECVVE